MCFLLIFPCILFLINFTAFPVRTTGNMSKMITFPANQFGCLNIYSFVLHKEKFLLSAKCRQILYHASHEHCWLLYRSLHTGFMESIYKQSLLCTAGVWNYFLSSIPSFVMFYISLYSVLKHPAANTSINCPNLFTAKSAPSLQVRNWKIHLSKTAFLSWVIHPLSCLAGPILVLVVEVLLLCFFLKILLNEESSKMWLCNQVLYNYRIRFVMLELKSELSQSSSYLYFECIILEESYISEKAEKGGI